MKKEIDYSKTVNEDDIINIEDDIKGVVVLLDGLVHADDAGIHTYQKDGYRTLSQALCKTIGELEKIKKSVNYMQEFI